ncbi:MAG TPA: ribosome biogenesis GTPase Der [Fimbriimonadales bacterium]|nr:ribosome biogenesis GTPase Der [Fimbriimonadales bacterium]
MEKKKLPCVVIVGRPNVGKSSLFNRIVGGRVAVVEAQPGVTRDRLYHVAEWDDKKFEVVDTGGILFSRDDPLIEQIRTQANIALTDADVVIFVVDVTDGVTPADQELADELRKIGKPILIAVNKVDNPERESLVSDFYALGLGEIFPISALHNRGISELMEKTIQLLPETTPTDEEEEPIKIAILGRPNVGKSSLLNALVGEQRAIVSEIPGTTRDAIDTEISFRGQKILLIDTAGLRRPGKVQGSLEYYLTLRAERALHRAHIGIIVVDGSLDFVDMDKRTAKMVHSAGKACIIAVNKWDLVEPPDGNPHKKSAEKKNFTKKIHIEIPELSYAPVCFVSAIAKTGLEALLETCLEVIENYHFRIQTGTLNRILREATYEKPYTRKGKPLRIYYGTQVGTAPPTFVLFCNDTSLVHFSYVRYLENKIREEFPLEGTPIRLLFRQSHEPKNA